jgi:HTH-type transcriptional regulator / antitoxin HigA
MSPELRFEPDYEVAPGTTLRSTLARIGMTQSDLADRTNLSVKHINQISQGIAPISHETALSLEKVTGVPARIWNGLESNYRDRLARLESLEVDAEDEAWVRSLPLKELIDRKILSKKMDTAETYDRLCRFFGVSNRKSWDRVWGRPLASWRKSPAFTSDPGAVATWLRLGELAAADVQTAEYDARQFRRALAEIRSLTREDPMVFKEEVVKLCAECGVAVVFVPEIPGTRASGAGRWLTPTKAIIQLSLRHKSDDHFWFSFFHEAAHILLHSKKGTFVSEDKAETDLPPDDDPAEEEANAFAATILIPRKFVQRVQGLQSEAEILRFADDIEVAPGIVVGRLQREGKIPWSHCNNLKRRVDFD